MAQEQRKPNTEQPAEQIKGQLSLDGFDTAALNAQEVEQAPEVQDEIRIDFPMDVDPELDPNSPQFNAERYNKEVMTPENVERLKHIMEDAQKKIEKDLSFSHTPEMAEALRKMTEAVEAATSNLANSAVSSMRSFSALYEQLLDGMAEVLAGINASTLQKAQEIIPYLEREIEAYNKKNPEAAPLTIDTVLNYFTVTGEPVAIDQNGTNLENPYIDLWKRAKKRQKIAEGRKKTAARRELATTGNTIVSLGGYVLTPSLEEYMNILTGKLIYKLPGEPKDFVFDNSGMLNKISLKNQPLVNQNELNTAYLAAITKAVNISEPEEQLSISLYAPAFLEEMGIDPRKSYKKRDDASLAELRRDYLMQNMVLPFDPLVMQMPDGSCYRLAGFVSYDIQKEELRLSVPAFFKLKDELQERSGFIPYNRLLHANIATENQMAVELANRILNGVLQRGTIPDVATYNKETRKKTATRRTVIKTTPDGETTKTVEEYAPDPAQGESAEQSPRKKKVTYTPKFSSLIKDCPQMQARLEEIDATPDKKNKSQLKNHILQRTFIAATKIIMEKSDAPKRYNDFAIEYQPPTVSTIGGRYKVTHTGLNRNYSYPALN